MLLLLLLLLLLIVTCTSIMFISDDVTRPTPVASDDEDLMNIMNEFVHDYLEQTPFVPVSSPTLTFISDDITDHQPNETPKPPSAAAACHLCSAGPSTGSAVCRCAQADNEHMRCQLQESNSAHENLMEDMNNFVRHYLEQTPFVQVSSPPLALISDSDDMTDRQSNNTPNPPPPAAACHLCSGAPSTSSAVCRCAEGDKRQSCTLCRRKLPSHCFDCVNSTKCQVTYTGRTLLPSSEYN